MANKKAVPSVTTPEFIESEEKRDSVDETKTVPVQFMSKENPQSSVPIMRIEPSVVPNKNESTQSENDTLMSLELIKQNYSVTKIARKLRQPEIWIRNSGVALLALYYSDGEESVETVADTKLYNIDRERVMYINHLLECQPEILPSREVTFTWLENNKPKYREVMFDELFSDEMMFCIRQGKKSLENKPETVPVPWAKIPENIADGFEQGIRLIEKVTEMVKQNVVQDKDVIWKLTAFYNRLTVAQNEFKDAMCEVRDRIQPAFSGYFICTGEGTSNA